MKPYKPQLIIGAIMAIIALPFYFVYSCNNTDHHFRDEEIVVGKTSEEIHNSGERIKHMRHLDSFILRLSILMKQAGYSDENIKLKQDSIRIQDSIECVKSGKEYLYE